MKPHRMSRWGWVLAITALVPTLAWAQDGPDSRRTTIEPDDPADRYAGTELHAWDVMNVTALPSNSILGSLWVGARDNVYVWSTRPVVSAPLGTQGGNVVIPEDPPVPPGGGPPVNFGLNSTLLRFDGASWSPVLEVQGEAAATLFGSDRNDVYASTDAPDGTVRVYHFNGNRWRLERLPDGVMGPAGDFAGDRARVFFRAGKSILMGTGRHWTVVYENEKLDPGHALVFLNRDQILAPGINGQAVWDGKSWSWTPASAGMVVHGAYGGRDAAGELHMFAIGSGADKRGMCIWQFREAAPGGLAGEFDEVLETPEAGGPNSGYGIEGWGSGVHDVYAIGFVQSRGCLMRFNGVAWSEIEPMADMTLPTSVWGTRQGDVFVALRDGRILRGLRHEPLVIEPEALEPEDGYTPGLGLAVRRESPRLFVLAYELPEARDVSVGVFDVAGRCVARLDRASRGAGAHQVRWDARDARPGVYFCRVRAGSFTDAGRIVIDR